jgi:hypothetical protein
MKKEFATLVFIAASFAAFAQTTAQDFIKTDCNGNQHHLFATLDSGKCVLMEFAMLPTCQPCIDAGKKIEIMKQSIQAAHPGMVEYFVLDFSGGHDCTAIHNWESSNGMFSTPFQHGETEVDYYGGMGMPTFVLVAGTEHKILWLNIGFTPSDTTVIKDQIDAFFAATGTQTALQPVNFLLSPNPVEDMLQVTVEDQNAGVESLQVIDVFGKKVCSQSATHSTTYRIDTAPLSKGTYFLQLLNSDNQMVGVKCFVKA